MYIVMYIIYVLYYVGLHSYWHGEKTVKNMNERSRRAAMDMMEGPVVDMVGWAFIKYGDWGGTLVIFQHGGRSNRNGGDSTISIGGVWGIEFK